MIKYETTEPGKSILEIRGSLYDIGCEASYMIVRIYKEVFDKDPAAAASLRRSTMYAINSAMDAIERGEFK